MISLVKRHNFLVLNELKNGLKCHKNFCNKDNCCSTPKEPTCCDPNCECQQEPDPGAQCCTEPQCPQECPQECPSYCGSGKNDDLLNQAENIDFLKSEASFFCQDKMGTDHTSCGNYFHNYLYHKYSFYDFMDYLTDVRNETPSPKKKYNRK